MDIPFENKRILLGVTGSIACYKAADLASKLAQSGAQVDVILTQAAEKFITALTFQSITGRRAYTEADLWGNEGHIQHIALGHSADLLVIAPASANTIAKLANGIADNLLTVAALAAQCPLIIAPTMDAGMYTHPATQANLAILAQRGAIIIGPAQGHLASGLTGVGRMVEPLEILGQARQVLSRQGPLAGRHILVTAGGTQETIDPVRVIANRSSGKQGYALAQAALDMGARVTLVSAATNLTIPFGVRLVEARSAQEMLEAVLAHLPQTDALLMAAAVADFRPAATAAHKIKKSQGIPDLQLENTPDILTQVARIKSETRYPEVLVGFAAESQALIENACSKLEQKKLDLIAANDISAADAGFGVDTNRVTLLDCAGNIETLPLLSKAEVSERILQQVNRLLQSKPIVHICTRAAWEDAQKQGSYQGDNYEKDGFIHLSRPRQVLQVANAYYPGAANLVLLWVVPGQLQAQLRWESVGSDTYPHLYGPLNLDAVTAVTDLQPDAEGVFRVLPSPT